MNYQIAVYIIVYLYLALGLSLLTDGVFSDILASFGLKFKLPKQIVAATFMAMASSGPELFTSLVDTFYFHNMIGIGTIIGSAIFNILIIVSAAALALKQPLQLQSYPIYRDLFSYLIVSLVLLATQLDGQMNVWNMWTLVSIYLYYLTYLAYTTLVSKLEIQNKDDKDGKDKENNLYNKCQSKRTWKTIVSVLRAKKQFLKQTSRDTIENPTTNTQKPHLVIDIQPEDSSHTIINQTNSKRCPSISLRSILAKIPLLLIQFWETLFYYTVPTKDSLLILGFLMSILWITCFTYLLVICCGQFARQLGIPDYLSGLLLLAPTTSLPDAMASILMARQGEGEAAIINALSSNIFDIAIGHGLPHFIHSFWNSTTYTLDSISIRSYIALAISCLIFWMSLSLRGWCLDRTTALILTTTYLIYVASEICFQLGLLKNIN